MTIYTIQNNLTGGIYIGQSVAFGERRSAHWCDLKHNRHGNPHLQASYNKHGKGAFSIEKLEDYDSVEDCDSAEQFYIGYLRFIGARVFNLKSGGHKRSMLSAETREKIGKASKARGISPQMLEAARIANTGKPMTEKSREALRRANIGKIVSDETKAKISRALSGRKKDPDSVERGASKLRGKKLSPERRSQISELTRLSWIKRRLQTCPI